MLLAQGVMDSPVLLVLGSRNLWSLVKYAFTAILGQQELQGTNQGDSGDVLL